MRTGLRNWTSPPSNGSTPPSSPKNWWRGRATSSGGSAGVGSAGYVYLLIEFQSTVDPWMALRVMVYIGLLWQRLAKDGELTPSGRLPPILPLVLYNGVRLWNAALELALLVEEIPGLERYRPQFRYSLLDEGRMADEELAPLRNLAAALFRLEKSRDAATIDRVLASLLEWL